MKTQANPRGHSRGGMHRLVLPLLGLALVATTGSTASPPGEDAKDVPSSKLPQADPLIREFAGSYYYGDGLGMNQSLVLKPDGHFGSEWRGCLGVYDVNKGTARREGDFLLFDLVSVKGRNPGRPVAYLPVRWGSRRYLVEKDEIPAFCEEIDAGREPRDRAHGSFYLRDDGWKAKPAGRPDLPKPWRDLLKDRPERRASP